jgi:hypothetical protein
MYTYIHIITETYIRIQIYNMFAKAMQTAATICPVLCDSPRPLQLSVEFNITSLRWNCSC